VQRVEAETSRSQSEFLRRLFERELKSEGKSETTINRYGLSIREWLQFSEAMNFPPMVTREHVAEFLAQRQERVAANAVRNDYMGLRRSDQTAHAGVACSRSNAQFTPVATPLIGRPVRAALQRRTSCRSILHRLQPACTECHFR
jgi:hypothetical protein